MFGFCLHFSAVLDWNRRWDPVRFCRHEHSTSPRVEPPVVLIPLGFVSCLAHGYFFLQDFSLAVFFASLFCARALGWTRTGCGCVLGAKKKGAGQEGEAITGGAAFLPHPHRGEHHVVQGAQISRLGWGGGARARRDEHVVAFFLNAFFFTLRIAVERDALAKTQTETPARSRDMIRPLACICHIVTG